MGQLLAVGFLLLQLSHGFQLLQQIADFLLLFSLLVYNGLVILHRLAGSAPVLLCSFFAVQTVTFHCSCELYLSSFGAIFLGLPTGCLSSFGIFAFVLCIVRSHRIGAGHAGCTSVLP